MSGRSVLSYLKDICRQLDEGTLQTRLFKVAVATAVPVSMLVAGCAYDEYGVPMYGFPIEEELCNDGVDDDSNGLTDCDDPVCDHVEYCLSCDDGHDNDGNGEADCNDASCAPHEACQ